MIKLPEDFKEFLKLLNEADVDYLLIGGYAVGYHGYPRTTADLDVWVDVSPANADRLLLTFRRFGMTDPSLTHAAFMEKGAILRMGLPPVRIEVMTDVDGVRFSECYARRLTVQLDGQPVSMIGLSDLRANKRASGRYKDLDDLEHLPDAS